MVLPIFQRFFRISIENPYNFYKDFREVSLTMTEEVVMWGSLSGYVVLSRGLAAFAAQ